MERRIITVLDELEVDNKQHILVSKKDREFLFDKENPYYQARNEEKKKSIFVLFSGGHYGILRSNLLSIIEDKTSNFAGDIFRSIKGITDDEFNESYFIHLLGKDGKVTWKKAKKVIFNSEVAESEDEDEAVFPERVEPGTIHNIPMEEATQISGMNVSYTVNSTDWASSATTATQPIPEEMGVRQREIARRRERQREEEIARDYVASMPRSAGLSSRDLQTAYLGELRRIRRR